MVWVPWPTVSSKVLVSVPVAFVAESVTLLEPTVVGVPEITPFVGLIVNPDGNPDAVKDEGEFDAVVA